MCRWPLKAKTLGAPRTPSAPHGAPREPIGAGTHWRGNQNTPNFSTNQIPTCLHDSITVDESCVIPWLFSSLCKHW